MDTDLQTWFEAGQNDRRLGNGNPALTAEDFCREIEDPSVASACAESYEKGFRS